MVVKKLPRICLPFKIFGAKILDHFVVVWVLLPIGGREFRCWLDHKSVISRFRFSSKLGHNQRCPRFRLTVDWYQLCIYLIIGAGSDTFGHSSSRGRKKGRFLDGYHFLPDLPLISWLKDDFLPENVQLANLSAGCPTSDPNVDGIMLVETGQMIRINHSVFGITTHY